MSKSSKFQKIAEENNRSGELEKDSSLSSSSKQSKNIC